MSSEREKKRVQLRSPAGADAANDCRGAGKCLIQMPTPAAEDVISRRWRAISGPFDAVRLFFLAREKQMRCSHGPPPPRRQRSASNATLDSLPDPVVSAETPGPWIEEEDITM